MSRNPHDQLIDQLLREILGGDRPRDMTARVLAQAKLLDKFRRRTWLGVGAALAASLALVAGLIMLWPHKYPGPTIDDQVAVQDNMPLQPGVTLYTPNGAGNVKLGGYVDITMSPETALNLGGSKYQEKVLLNQGQLDVDVTRHKGQFDIAVGPATVHVTGTRFRVKVGEDNTPTAWVKKLYVAVKEGSVEVQNLPGAGGTQTVAAGQERDFPLSTVLKSTNGGLVYAAQQGARIGARGGLGLLLPRNPLASNPAPAPTPPKPVLNNVPPPPNAGSTANTANTLRPVQLLTTPAAANRLGAVQHTGTIFYLESRDGNFFMFERSTVAATHPDWLTLPAGQYTRVVWAEGVVRTLEKYTPPTPANPASPPTVSPATSPK